MEQNPDITNELIKKYIESGDPIAILIEYDSPKSMLSQLITDEAVTTCIVGTLTESNLEDELAYFGRFIKIDADDEKTENIISIIRKKGLPVDKYRGFSKSIAIDGENYTIREISPYKKAIEDLNNW